MGCSVSCHARVQPLHEGREGVILYDTFCTVPVRHIAPDVVSDHCWAGPEEAMPDQAKVLLQLKQLASSHIQECLWQQLDISLQQIRVSQHNETGAAALLVSAPAQPPVTSAMRMEKVDQSRREAKTSSTSSLITTGMQPCRTASSALGLQPSPAAGQQQLSGLVTCM